MSQQSSKYKPWVVCHCRQCKRGTKYRQSVLKASKRQYRHRVNCQLRQGLSVDLSRVSAGYTD